jgi:hypothetical protein
MPAAKQRPAVMPSRPSFAPRTKRVCPWHRPPRHACGTNCFLILSVPPACRAGRRHRQHRQRPLTLLKLVRSRSNEIESRASEDVLRGFGQGRAVTSCAGSALPLAERDKFARLDKSTLCDIKLAAVEGNGRPRPGGPRETPCRSFYDHTM